MENCGNQKCNIDRKPIVETHISFEKSRKILLLEDDEVHIITEEYQNYIHQNRSDNAENHAFSGFFYPRKSFRKRIIHPTVSQGKHESIKPSDENIEKEHFRCFLFAKKHEDENPYKKGNPRDRDKTFSVHG